MSYASQSGRARTSARSPQAFAVCQRCGIWYNRVDLQFQNAWRGAQLQDIHILVCRTCYDVPQQQLRAITLPPDPVPVYFPSVENFDAAETDYRTVAFAPILDPITGIPIIPEVLRVTQDCENRITIPYGEPSGLEQNAIMPLQVDAYGKTGGVPTAYGVVLPVLSVFASGFTVTVTCSSVHNLQPGYQVSVEGLSNGNGFFSVQVPTATVFTYQTAQPVTANMTTTTRMCTANVGLPRGSETFPIPYGYQATQQPPQQVTPAMLPGPPLDVTAV
jgi:hypothetical protein